MQLKNINEAVTVMVTERRYGEQIRRDGIIVINDIQRRRTATVEPPGLLWRWGGGRGSGGRLN